MTGSSRIPLRAWLGVVVAILGMLALAARHEQWFVTRHGADRVAHMIDWPEGCSPGGINIERPLHGDGYQWRATAIDQALIICGDMGPGVSYSRFGTVQALRTAVARRHPRYRYC